MYCENIIVKVWWLTLFIGISLLSLCAVFSNISPNTANHDLMIYCGMYGGVIFIVCISLLWCKPLKILICGKKERNLSQILQPILFHEPTAILAISGRNEDITNAHLKYIQNNILDELEQRIDQEQNNQV